MIISNQESNPSINWSKKFHITKGINLEKYQTWLSYWVENTQICFSGEITNPTSASIEILRSRSAWNDFLQHAVFKSFSNSSIAHKLLSGVESPSSEVSKNKEMAGCLKWLPPQPMFALKLLKFEVHKFISPNVHGQIKLWKHQIARNHYRIACLMFYLKG